MEGVGSCEAPQQIRIIVVRMIDVKDGRALVRQRAIAVVNTGMLTNPNRPSSTA